MAVMLLAALLCFCSAAAAQEVSPPPAATAADARAVDLAEIRDRILSSLGYRGELADKIIEAGMTEKLVELRGEHTYADARLALLEWIRRNPDAAARLALDLRHGGRPASAGGARSFAVWRVSDGFVAKVRALAAAAGGAGISPEELETAARRMYEGTGLSSGLIEALPGGVPGPGGGRPASAGKAYYEGEYSDFKLDRSGLERELSGAEGLLKAMRGPSGRGPAGAEKAYAAAGARYADFVVAASALKGRAVLSAGESEGLERRRLGLRSGLAALALAGREADAAKILSLLPREGAAPGAGGMRGAAEALLGLLREYQERAASGQLPLKEQYALVRLGEEAFSAFYIKYSVYSGLLVLRAGAAEAGYSCLADFLLHGWLRRFHPESPYVRARRELAAAAPGLAAGLELAAQDPGAALERHSAGAESLARALAAVRAASARNRALQYFLWGAIFSPAEVKISASGGRAVFRPEFGVYAAAAGLRGGRRE
jgi:hypothetical protein